MRACLSSLSNLMKAIRVSEFGDPSVLKLRDVIIPSPSHNEVLIRVRAAGVNPVETYLRAGQYPTLPTLPFTPGHDAAGTVESVGSKVTLFKKGDRVFVHRCSGAYAQFATADESAVFQLPARLTYAQGAALPIPYRTAYIALKRVNASPSEKVLVHGASGGVGIAAIQFARTYGMTVFGTAGSEEGLALARQHGAHTVFNHKMPGYLDLIREATHGEGVNVILEMLANVNLGEDLKLLAFDGRVAIIGNRGTVEINPRETMSKRLAIVGVGSPTDQEIKEAMAAVVGGVDQGWINPIVGKEYPLEKAPEAHLDIIEGKAKGKMVLNVS